MSNIFTGNEFRLFYNVDVENQIPDITTNVQINELASMPVLTIRSNVQTIETYDSDYSEKLLSEQDVSNIDIRVNYIPTDISHKFLDDAAKNQETFQLILQYVLEDNKLSYSTVNGTIVKTALAGDKDSVVTKTYSFVPTQMIARMALAEASTPVVVGMYGLGANGNNVPQYQTPTPDGNAFVKVPAAQAGNPASADMMGVGFVDGTTYSSIAMTKSGTLSLFAKNANTAWTRILTATQISDQYVPLTRTINGKALSANISITKGDVGLSNVTNDAQLKIASNLSDLNNVATARNNLGLGTAAVVNTGTSGAAIPLMNGVNGWSGTQSFNASATTFGQTSTSNGVGIEVGSTVTPGTAYLDFHSSGTTADYDARISVSGGSSTFGQGNINFNANSVNIPRLTLSTDLEIVHGGTGASTAAAARTNLALNRFDQWTNETWMYSADNSLRLGLTATEWGCYSDATSKWIALNLSKGGTGATTAAEARANLQAFYVAPNPLSATDNLNNIRGQQAGVYRNQTTAYATAANNYPIQVAGSLVVVQTGANGPDGCVQTYNEFISGIEWSRAYNPGNGGGWSTWTRSLRTGDYGIGTAVPNLPLDQTNQFISDSAGNTAWAPQNGTGIQMSYASQRCGQLWMTTTGKMYSRFNLISTNAQEPKATLPWNEVAYANTPNTWSGLNTFNGETYFNGDITNTASRPFSIRSTNPTMSFVESDSTPANSTYLFVADGGNFRLHRDNTGGTALFTYSRASNTMSFGSVDTQLGVVRSADTTINGQLKVINNSEAIKLVAPTGSASYIMAMRDNSNTVANRRWYVGNGGADNTVVLFNAQVNNTVELTTAGSIRLTSRSNGTGTGNTLFTDFNTDGTIVGPLGTVTQTASDVRLKSDIVEAKGGALDRINAIGCVEFTWDGEGRRDRGFVAQQIADIDELYTFRPTEDGYLNYSITALMSDTFGAIQELTAINNDQSTKIEELKSNISNQQSQIDELKSLVQQLLNDK